MRYSPGSVPHLVVGTVLTAGLTGLAVAAAADDSYFVDGGISHWEVLTTRTSAGAVALFLLGAAVVAVLALACLVRGLLPTRYAFPLPLRAVALISAITFLLAWVTLVGGD